MDEFSCKSCGEACSIAPADGSGATCPKCCPDHEYEYDRHERAHLCKHCGEPAPEDWFDD